MTITSNDQAHRWAGMSAVALLCALTFTADGATQSSGGFPEPVHLGVEKFPDEIYAPFLISTGFNGMRLRQSMSYSTGGTMLQHVKQERATSDEPWEFMESTENTSYLITAVASRKGGDEVFVAGLDDKGKTVVEKWIYSPRRHGWRVDVSLPDDITALGQPAPAADSQLVLNGNGAWRGVSEGERALPPARRVPMYQSDTGPWHGMAVDPQGRYLIAFDMELDRLVQLDLTSTPYAETVLVGPGHPEAIALGGNIQIMDFTGGVRHVLVRPALGRDVPGDPYLLGIDANNDGVFESFDRFTKTEWSGLPYAVWSNWNLFVD